MAVVRLDDRPFAVGAGDGRGDEVALTEEIRDADKSLFVEARTASGNWVHRNYLAK